MLQVNRCAHFFSFLFLCFASCFIGFGKEVSAVTSQTSNWADETIGNIEMFLLSNTEHYEAYYSLGTLYEEKGMLDEALRAFSEASRLNPSSETYLIGQGRILNKKREYNEAITLFEKAFSINPERMEIYYYLGIGYSKTGKPDSSMILWQGAIRKTNDPVNIHFLKGLVAKEKGDFERAEILLNKALELRPDFAAAHMVLESLYCAMGNYGDAYHHAEIHRRNYDLLFQAPISSDLQPTQEKQVTAIANEMNYQSPLTVTHKDTEEHERKLVERDSRNLIINDISDALYYSGNTRMLAMKMAKLYGIQLVKDYPIGKRRIAEKELRRTMRSTNGIYRELLALPLVTENPEVGRAIRTAQTDWYELEKKLLAEPTQKGFLDVLTMSDNLLEKNQIMTKYLEALAPYTYSELIDIAGQQRMYTMRLARDYLAVSMGLEKKLRMDYMLETLSTFDNAMLTLEGASENTAEIKGLIKSITKMEWKKVSSTVNKCIDDNGKEFNISIMINFCEILLEKTDRLTKLYVDVSRQNTGT